MTKHYFAIFSLACTFALLCGCASRNAQSATSASLKATAMPPPLQNRVRVCSLNTNFSKQAELKEYVLDVSKVPEVYQNEIKYYTINALNYVGLKVTSNSELVIAAELTDSHLDVIPLNPRRERKTVNYQLTATEKGNRIWTISTGCSGRASEISNYWFPGLVAAFLPYFGENRSRPIAIGKYPLYLNAVYAAPEK